MSLSAGTRLGHYEVTALIGEGGMGQVYQATDTQLNRQVALKILPDPFADDPDRLARFQREAQVLASLNHSNIAQIHGIEQSGDSQALVLELVGGPTLADRIANGPIPIDEVLPIAKQIAEALGAAHEAGVIHRDLKPANIKVRPDGTVKVLDFGLAKALVGDTSSPDLSQSPTMTATVGGGTRAGMILGTAAYMSPEQARGQPVDRGADIWAFGCVLYEMLTARSAFGADTLSDTIAAVLKADIDLHRLPASVPLAGQRLVRRCLERDARKRTRDVTDGLLLIEEELANGVERTPTARVSVIRRILPWAAAAIGVIVGIVGWNLRPAPPVSRDAMSVLLPDGLSLPSEMRILAAVSPDGRDLVFVGQDSDTTRLYRRPLDQVDAVSMPDTEGATNPFFSPDGAWVGFKVGSNLKKVPLAGGVAQTVCDLPEHPAVDRFTLGATWASDDTIWFAHANTGLYRVAAAGGVPELITVPGEEGENAIAHFGAQPLPDGRGLLYTVYTGSVSANRVAVYDRDTREHRVLAAGSRPWFAASGHVVFARGDTLWALPFDAERLEATGAPFPVREGVRLNSVGTTQATLGADGTLVYVADTSATGGRGLVWVGRDGAEDQTVGVDRAYHWPRLSPDETKVVVGVRENSEYDIWIRDLVRGFETRLTDTPGWDWIPMWTPEGDHVVFTSENAVVRAAADGTGEVEQIVSAPGRALYAGSWSPNGRHLQLNDWDPGGATGWDLSMVTLEGDFRREFLLETEHVEGSGELSPDGRWLAYGSNESGRFEVYVTPFPDVDSRRVRVSTEGGLNPAWSPAGGGELFYQRGIDCPVDPNPSFPDPNDNAGALSLEGCRSQMMSVVLDTDATLRPGNPRMLFDGLYYSEVGRHYDVSQDGQRFLMIKETGALRELIVVRNWTAELDERLAVDGVD